jgi:hypothetical protein
MKAATLTVLAMLSAVPMVGIAAQPAEGNSDHQQMLAKLKITLPLRPNLGRSLLRIQYQSFLRHPRPT